AHGRGFGGLPLLCIPERLRLEAVAFYPSPAGGSPLMRLLTAVVYVLLAALGAGPAFAAAASGHRSEIDLVVPALSQVSFLGTDGHTLPLFGLGICVLGLVFGLVIYGQLKNLPVHRSMREISELIYETCKTYLVTQGKFILILELFIGAIMIVYFG